MPNAQKLFFIHLLFKNFGLEIFVSNFNKNIILEWLKKETRVLRLFDILEETVNRFASKLTDFVDPLQNLILAILNVSNLMIEKNEFEEKYLKNYYKNIEKNVLSIWNKILAKYDFINFSSKINQFIQNYFLPKMKDLSSKTGTLSKNFKNTFTILSENKQFKIFFLKNEDLLYYLLKFLDNENPQEVKSIIEILIKLFSQEKEKNELNKIVCENDDSHQIIKIQKQNNTIIEESLISKTKNEDLKEFIQNSSFYENSMKEFLFTKIDDNSLIEESLVVMFGKKILEIILLKLENKEIKSDKSHLQKLFSGGNSVELVSMILSKKCSQYFQNEENFMKRLIDLFFLPLNINFLEKKIFGPSPNEKNQIQKYENDKKRIKSLFVSVSNLLMRCGSIDSILIEKVLPLFFKSISSDVIIHALQLLSASLKNSSVSNLSKGINFILSTYQIKNEFDFELDHEQMFLNLQEFYDQFDELSQNLNNVQNQFYFEIGICLACKTNIASDSSCRNLGQNIFERYLKFLVSKKSEAKSFVNQNSIILSSKSSIKKTGFQLLKNYFLPILLKNLKKEIKTEDEIRNTITSLLNYSKMTDQIKRDESDSKNLPFYSLCFYENSIYQMLSIKSIERLSGTHNLLKSLQQNTEFIPEKIIFKDILIPFIEKLSKMKLKELSSHRLIKGKVSQSRTDSLRGLLDVKSKLIANMLSKISFNDFQIYLKKKMDQISKKENFNSGEIDLKIAEKEFYSKLILTALSNLKSLNIFTDCVSKLNEQMRNSQKNKEIFYKSDQLIKLNNQEISEGIKNEIKNEFGKNINNDDEIKRIRDLSKETINKELIILGEIEGKFQNKEIVDFEISNNLGMDQNLEAIQEEAIVRQDFVKEKKKIDKFDIKSFLKNLLKNLLSIFYKKGQDAKKSRREQKLTKEKTKDPKQIKEIFSFGEGIVELTRLMSLGKFKFEFSKVIIRFCELLSNPDLKLRTLSRKSLANISILTGPFVFDIVLKEMKETLVEGKLKFVRNYSIAFIFEEIFKHAENAENKTNLNIFKIGDIDLYIEEVIDMILEEIEDFSIENRDNNKTKGFKWKEMITSKNHLIMFLFGKYIDMNSTACLQILEKFNIFLTKTKKFKNSLKKITNLLNHFSKGILENKSFSSPIAFYLSYSQLKIHIQLEQNEIKTLPNRNISNKETVFNKKHNLAKTYKIQKGAAEGKSVFRNFKKEKGDRSQLISKAFSVFVLNLLENVLRQILCEEDSICHNEFDKNIEIDISMKKTKIRNLIIQHKIDLKTIFESLCSIIETSKEIDIRERSLSVIFNLHKLELIPNIKDEVFLDVLQICLKDLDSSQPKFVDIVFKILPLVFTFDHEIENNTRNDLAFSVHDFFYLSDFHFAVPEFVIYCFENNILLNELMNNSNTFLVSFFEAKNEKSKILFGKVLLSMFKSSVIGPNLAKKLIFDLVRNLDTADDLILLKCPLLLFELVNSQDLEDILKYFDMVVLSIETIKSNWSSKKSEEIGNFYSIWEFAIHCLILKSHKVTSDSNKKVLENILQNCKEIFEEIFENSKPKIKNDSIDLIGNKNNKFFFDNEMNFRENLSEYITNSSQNSYKKYLESSWNERNFRLENINSDEWKPVNIFGIKYFEDVFSKAKALLLSDNSQKLYYVGLSLLQQLYVFNSKAVFKRLIETSENQSFEDFIEDIDSLQGKSNDEVFMHYQQKIMMNQSSIFGKIMIFGSEICMNLTNTKNFYDNEGKIDEVNKPNQQNLENIEQNSFEQDQIKISLLIISLLKNMTEMKNIDCIDQVLSILEIFYFEKENERIQVYLQDIAINLVNKSGIDITSQSFLPKILLLLFSQIGLRNSLFAKNDSLFETLSQIYFASVLKDQSELRNQIETVILTNIKTGIKNIGSCKSLIFKSSKILKSCLKKMQFIKETGENENSFLFKNKYPLSDELTESIYIMSENAEILQIDKLKNIGEDILILSRNLFPVDILEKKLLKTRISKKEKRDGIKNRLKRLAITDPTKYSEIKIKINQKNKRNLQKRKQLKTLYKHDTKLKKIKEF